MQLSNASLWHQQSYVNGEWISATKHDSIPVYNPFDNSELGTVPNCQAEETKQAIESAHKAWLSWRNTSAYERSNLLHRWADLIEDNIDDLAKMLTIEQGKPIKEATGEIQYGNAFIRWFAGEAIRVYGDIIPPNTTSQHLVVIKQPVGVVGAITPWNFPNAMLARKLAAAFAAGCTMVAKPASDTPYSALALADLAEKAGFPLGVLNIVTGDPDAIGIELTSNPLVRKISFTGSTKIGSLLMRQSADTVKKISLELGGNAPFIVFDDADIAAAAEGAATAKYRNSGQTCVCANRILVQSGIYEKFCEEFVNVTKKLKLGNGLEQDVTQGPLINNKAITKVQDLVDDAIHKGAKALTGGGLAENGNLFFSPTVLTEVNIDMQLTQTEIFGPVAPIIRFEQDEDAFAIANDTPYGLASYFYSRDMARIWRVSEALEYGMVGVNTGIVSNAAAPFGGIKHSGLGREGSKYGIEDYLEMKYICMETS